MKIPRPNLALLPCLVAGLLASPIAHAQTPAASGATAPPARKSTFTTGGAERNPFWPVGWKPGAKAVEVVPVVSVDLFNVSAILLGPPNLAVINGKDYEQGAVIIVPLGGKEERVRIDAIRDGFILLNHRGRPITVPLNRGNQPKPAR